MSAIGVVLAGGQSSRMGQDKALLRLPTGETLLEHSIELLNPLKLDEVIISRASRPDELVAEIRCIADQTVNLGPLGGIAAVINAFPDAQELLIIPVDLPRLTTSLLNELLEHGRNQQRASYFGEHYLPCYLPINDATTAYIAQQINNTDARRSVYGLLKNAEAVELSVDNRLLLNANTPEEWHTMVSSLSQSQT